MPGWPIRGLEDEIALRLGDHIRLRLVPGVVGFVSRGHVLHHLDEVELLGGLHDLAARAAVRQEAICASATLEVCVCASVWRLCGTGR